MKGGGRGRVLWRLLEGSMDEISPATNKKGLSLSQQPNFYLDRFWLKSVGINQVIQQAWNKHI